MNSETKTTDAATPIEQERAKPTKLVKPKKASAPKKGAKRKPAKKTAAKKAAAPRTDTKRAKILGLIARKQGATLQELMKAAKWQAHSVRGFLSTAQKTQGITILSTRSEDGVRNYKSKGGK